MKKFSDWWAVLPVLCLLMAACGVSDDRFRLEGKFKNLNQGEFYIYGLDDARKDTIKVNNGEFVYDIAIGDTVTLSLVFPNFSEMPIFARPGALVKMNGDVSHLKDTEIKGTKENEDMTFFRLNTNELMPPEVVDQARLFVEDHPQSVVSVYLLRRYFVQTVKPDYKEALRLCDLLLQQQPTNIPLVQLHQQLEVLARQVATGRLSAFRAVDTEGRTVDNKQLSTKVNVILTWASWNFESQTVLRQLRRLERDHPKELTVVSVCLDASPAEGKNVLERDSIGWSNICDGKLWESPIVTQLALTYVPDNIVVDKGGNVVARSLDNNALKEKVESMLKD